MKPFLTLTCNFFSIHSNRQIPVISDLSVGDNLQDHIYAHGIHFTVEPPITLSQQTVFTAKNLVQYFSEGTGPMSLLGGVEGLAFVRTKYANSTKDWPDIELHFTSGEFIYFYF